MYLYIYYRSVLNMYADLPAVFQLLSKMSHHYFLFVSMVMKTGFPA